MVSIFGSYWTYYAFYNQQNFSWLLELSIYIPIDRSIWISLLDLPLGLPPDPPSSLPPNRHPFLIPL